MSPLVSTIIVIITFIISQLVAHYSRKNELKRSWYFKAYLDKSIEKVNDFFLDVREITKKSIKKSNSITNDNDRISYITKKLEKISDAQRDFIFQVLYPLKGAYPEVFKDITILMDNFYDVHSHVFDKNLDNTEPFKKYLEEIDIIKNNLMTFLAIPVLKNRQSKKLRRELAEQNALYRRLNYGKIFSVFISIIFLFGSIKVLFFLPINFFSKNKYDFNNERALFDAQHEVKLRLISPSTADFNTDSENSVKQINDTIFRVNSYVDSQNEYGATLRTIFKCKITYSKSNLKYKCEELNLKYQNQN